VGTEVTCLKGHTHAHPPLPCRSSRRWWPTTPLPSAFWLTRCVCVRACVRVCVRTCGQAARTASLCPCARRTHLPRPLYNARPSAGSSNRRNGHVTAGHRAVQVCGAGGLPLPRLRRRPPRGLWCVCVCVCVCACVCVCVCVRVCNYPHSQCTSRASANTRVRTHLLC
jgi:hypothetical protein